MENGIGTLNKLPDGSPSPKYRCTAVGYACGEEKTVVLQEWWYDGRLVESIEDSAEDYFYGEGESGFDKSPFNITSIEKVL